MAVNAFSDEWAVRFKDEVNKSSVYKAAAKGWKWTVGLVIEAEPDKNVPESVGVVMESCQFVITAPYTRWKQVATKELDATKGMLQGKLKLKGDLPTIVRYTKASQELTECTTRVPVQWPDER